MSYTKEKELYFMAEDKMNSEYNKQAEKMSQQIAELETRADRAAI